MKAKFIGRHGSCTLKRGIVYDLEPVNVAGYSLSIQIKPCSSSFGSITVPYDTFESFLNNWEFEKDATKGAGVLFTGKEVDEMVADSRNYFRQEKDREVAKIAADYQQRAEISKNSCIAAATELVEAQKTIAEREDTISKLVTMLYSVTEG